MEKLLIDPVLLSLKPYAVEARYEEGPFPLSADRAVILARIVTLRDQLDQELTGE